MMLENKYQTNIQLIVNKDLWKIKIIKYLWKIKIYRKDRT